MVSCHGVLYNQLDVSLVHNHQVYACTSGLPALVSMISFAANTLLLLHKVWPVNPC